MAHPALSDEARFELAMAAAARERRNAPRFLLFLAGLLVLLALVIALFQWRAWSRDGREARIAMARQTAVAAQLTEYAALKAKSGGAEKEHAGFDKLVSTGESTATQVGLAKPAKPREPERPDVKGNLRYRTWAYARVSSPRAGPLMDWVRLMLERMPGLRVSSIKLTPGADGWKMDVTFAGIERVGGGS